MRRLCRLVLRLLARQLRDGSATETPGSKSGPIGSRVTTMRVHKIAVIGLLSGLYFSASSYAACKAPGLRQGMNYTAARKIVINRGFQAPALSAYGYSESDEKVVSECNGDVELCNRFPEIDSCGSGHCLMKFRDAYGNTLSISIYGDLSHGYAQVESFDLKCKR